MIRGTIVNMKNDEQSIDKEIRKIVSQDTSICDTYDYNTIMMSNDSVMMLLENKFEDSYYGMSLIYGKKLINLQLYGQLQIIRLYQAIEPIIKDINPDIKYIDIELVKKIFKKYTSIIYKEQPRFNFSMKTLNGDYDGETITVDIPAYKIKGLDTDSGYHTIEISKQQLINLEISKYKEELSRIDNDIQKLISADIAKDVFVSNTLFSRKIEILKKLKQFENQKPSLLCDLIIDKFLPNICQINNISSRSLELYADACKIGIVL